MASYKDIQGFNIQNLSSDPVPFAQAKENDPWGGTWASGGSMNTARMSAGSSGTQTAAMIASGAIPAGGNVGTLNVEQYNGTAWTEVNNVSQGRRGGMGIGSSQPVSMFVGGIPIVTTPPSPPTTVTGVNEIFDGTSWTESSDLNTARVYSAPSGNGSSTAALIAGGATLPATGVVELWNGSTWTETTDLNTTRSNVNGFGISTDLIAAGGSAVANTEKWNGSTWTELNDLNTARASQGGSAGTSSSSGITFGGQDGPGTPIALTESWDGTNWTEVADLVAAEEYIRGMGSSSSAWAAGGNSSPSAETLTQEWAFTGIPPSAPAAGYSDAIVGQIYYNTTTGSFKAIKAGGAPIGTWASGGSLNNAKNSGVGAGTQTAGLAMFGSNPTTRTGQTETYDGTSWTSVNPGNTGRNEGGGSGTQTAAIAMAGTTNSYPPFLSNLTETWDGTNWTEVAELNVERSNLSNSFGTQTANIIAGGATPPASEALTESWNGTSWSPVNSMNTGRGLTAEIGTQTAGIVAGGSYSADVETWDGTSWTTTTSINTGRGRVGGSGTQSSALVFAGYTSAPTAVYANTEFWNGSSWTELNDMATARYGGSPATSGSSSSALLGGGNNLTTIVTTTEEFTAADFTINTLTTS